MKPCEYCFDLVSIRYRIQHDDTKSWVLVCPICWKKLNQDNPYYRYGGTWKAKKDQ